ncbi:START-like domain-containing protein [Fulvivirga imtechensis]|nr:START-like domain-containing protein [Fulvivirga imtechensis]
MSRHLFTTDFEINASTKMLYPYLSTASGLSQWLADDVTINEDKVFNFIWDEEDHKARMVSHRNNHYVKFEFLPETEDDAEDPAYFELRLELNELTQSVFIKITDYSDMDDNEELFDLWHSLVENLKETVGG